MKKAVSRTKAAPKNTVKDLKAEIDLLYHLVDIISDNDTLDTMLAQMAGALAQSMLCDSCFIYLADQAKTDLILSGAYPPHPHQIGKIRLNPGEGITGWVAEHKKPVALDENAHKDSRFKLFQSLPEDKFEALLSVPILLQGEVIGVINLMNQKPRQFAANRIKLVTTISAQIAGAIEKARLRKAASFKNQQIELVSQLSRSIVSGTYLQEILQLIVTMTAQTMNSKICSLMLYDETAKELKIAATQSLSDDYKKKPPLKLNKSIAGKVVQDKTPLTVLDVTADARYSYPEIAKKEGLKSMVAVPMLINNRPIGVINCYTTAVHRFSDDEVAILQTIANQAALAIENTRLLEESQTAKEALETRKTIERAKGILMRQRGISEPEAFQFVQRQAMNMRRTMKEIAEAILLSDGIAKP